MMNSKTYAEFRSQCMSLTIDDLEAISIELCNAGYSVFFKADGERNHDFYTALLESVKSTNKPLKWRDDTSELFKALFTVYDSSFIELNNIREALCSPNSNFDLGKTLNSKKSIEFRLLIHELLGKEISDKTPDLQLMKLICEWFVQSRTVFSINAARTEEGNVFRVAMTKACGDSRKADSDSLTKSLFSVLSDANLQSEDPTLLQ